MEKIEIMRAGQEKMVKYLDGEIARISPWAKWANTVKQQIMSSQERAAGPAHGHSSQQSNSTYASPPGLKPASAESTASPSQHDADRDSTHRQGQKQIQKQQQRERMPDAHSCAQRHSNEGSQSTCADESQARARAAGQSNAVHEHKRKHHDPYDRVHRRSQCSDHLHHREKRQRSSDADVSAQRQGSWLYKSPCTEVSQAEAFAAAQSKAAPRPGGNDRKRNQMCDRDHCQEKLNRVSRW